MAMVNFSDIKTDADDLAEDGENAVYPDESNFPLTSAAPIADATTTEVPEASRAPDQEASEPTARPVIEGTLKEFGTAKYGFDENGTDKFYIKLEDPDGNLLTRWGDDLERAIADSKTQAGDKIRLHTLIAQDALKKSKNNFLIERIKEFTRQAAPVGRASAPSAPAPASTAVELNKAPPRKASANTELASRILAAFKEGVDEKGTQVFTASRFLRNVSFTEIPPALLKTASNDSLAAEGMVAQALSKGWNPINASGTPEFQANVFYHAVRLGIQVSNYVPNAADLALLAKSNLSVPEWVTTNQISPSPAAPAAKHKPSSSAGMGM